MTCDLVVTPTSNPATPAVGNLRPMLALTHEESSNDPHKTGK